MKILGIVNNVYTILELALNPLQQDSFCFLKTRNNKSKYPTNLVYLMTIH